VHLTYTDPKEESLFRCNVEGDREALWNLRSSLKLRDHVSRLF